MLFIQLFQFVYFIIALSVSCHLLKMLIDSNLTREQIKEMLFTDTIKEHISDNPHLWNWILATYIIVVGLLWPITSVTIVREISDYIDDINHIKPL